MLNCQEIPLEKGIILEKGTDAIMEGKTETQPA